MDLFIYLGSYLSNHATIYEYVTPFYRLFLLKVFVIYAAFSLAVSMDDLTHTRKMK
jgi:hypothetical protein